MSWTIWPREGGSVNIGYRYGKVTLSSADPNWHMVWEDPKSEKKS